MNPCGGGVATSSDGGAWTLALAALLILAAGSTRR
jgi:MYXO-CTERM domain-containing protein